MKTLFFDGAMGTQIQSHGLVLGDTPESFNILHPDIIKSIHLEYKKAGANFLTTNTFGANSLKLKTTGYSAQQIIKSAVTIAKSAAENDCKVALDVGPLGELIAPMGTLSFDEAYKLFAEQMILGEKYGADLILIETMTDLKELKAALLAARENTSLPVFCTMSFEENMRTFMGTSVECMALTVEPYADAIGINCSLGPKEILPIVEKLLKYTSKPVIVQPNAGLPKVLDGNTVFDVTPSEFAEYGMKFYELGVSIFGGCCGTTPAHIKALNDLLKGRDVKIRDEINLSAICSASKLVNITSATVIGERINPTGKKLFKEALKNNDIDYILKQGLDQVEAGADILDVNVGLPEIDEKIMMQKVLSELQSITDTPLQIDSTDPIVLETALREYAGKAIVNSVNGEQKSMDMILPLIKKYGAMVIGLTLDENGIPKTADKRVEIAEKILKNALKHGIKRENIIIDCLTLTVSAEQEGAYQTLNAVRMIKEKLGLKTVLGVSNISFGLPRRDIINEIFLSQALQCGLDLPIINPNSDGMMKVIMAHRVLHNIDKNSEKYIEKYVNTVAAEATKAISSKTDNIKTEGLTDIVVKGLKDNSAAETMKLLKTKTELEIVNEFLIPALDIVGERYEKGMVFLPQLIQSAETVKNAFAVIKKQLVNNKKNAISKGTIIMATVKGDIHDIGKNIVKVILENYGYTIIDLGKNVPPEAVVDCALKNNIKLVGLSALMTTTVKSMQETIKQLKEADENITVFVGGAVLTEDYAISIGADYYSKDAKQSVEIAKKFFA